MALDTSNDVVMEVARAADPARAANVTQRLNALGAFTPPAAAGADFAQAMHQTSEEVAKSRGAAVAMRTRFVDAEKATNDRTDKARVKFEAAMLNNFVSEMMPKDAPDVFGEGTAGDMWKSMLSEKISDELAKSGTLGISRRLFAGHANSSAAALSHAERADALGHNATLTSGNDLSLPSGASVSSGSFLFTRGKSI